VFLPSVVLVLAHDERASVGAVGVLPRLNAAVVYTCSLQLGVFMFSRCCVGSEQE
jgi:hypothetical protein